MTHMMNIDFEGTTAELIAEITNEDGTTEISFESLEPNNLFDKFQNNKYLLEELINRECNSYYDALKGKGKIQPSNDSHLFNKGFEFRRDKVRIIRTFMSSAAFKKMNSNGYNSDKNIEMKLRSS
jgi:hypothetical protein